MAGDICPILLAGVGATSGPSGTSAESARCIRQQCDWWSPFGGDPETGQCVVWFISRTLGIVLDRIDDIGSDTRRIGR